LVSWLADKRQALQGNASGATSEICLPLTGVDKSLPANARLFYVPSGLIRILNRDLKTAGIPKKDERGRTVDVHALRHTFGTHLSKGGVAPRTAQAAMRHSDIRLTMNTYTDPKLLDVHGAMEALPDLPLIPTSSEAQQATGTVGHPREFAPGFAPKTDNAGPRRSTGDNRQGHRTDNTSSRAVDVSSDADKRKEPLSTSDNDSLEWATQDSNQRPLRCETTLGTAEKPVISRAFVPFYPSTRPLQAVSFNCIVSRRNAVFAPTRWRAKRYIPFWQIG